MTTTLGSRTKDITGQRFGRLTVVAYAGGVVYGNRGAKGLRASWSCKCDCGATLTVTGDSLRKGNTQSCGCLMKQVNAARLRSHGQAGSKEYGVWRAMKGRCLLPAYPNYPYYGGRGITVCQRWLDSFENFLTDMGPRPSSTHTLERKDNDGHYCPENCVWALRAAQRANRRCSLRLTFQGETLLLTEWSQRTGIQYMTLFYRLKRGWPVDRILAPVQP